MTPPAFRASIRTAISNASLQAALDYNAERRGAGRLAAFGSLPDWQDRRQRAHAVRAQVIERLDEYVQQFTAAAVANGIRVHRATDRVEAVRLVLEISQRARRQPDRRVRIAKSKSMVSEEIELNHALEQHGIEVVETDLGEYIVQLRGEKPAHLITPSVHLRRQEVGQLFQEKLGIPYTEDIAIMTAAARKALREIFLTADVGISGVNFGVAETGTLCIVTNEGNGRMVTTLPPVHIALMGMERIAPTLQDLALMLSLLPRSATGQKLSVYTQLIQAARRAGEADGAGERHIVLVDNGRTRLRASPLRESLYCIRCGACLNACPVFRELGGHAYVGLDGSIAAYAGPIGSVVSPGLLGMHEYGHLAQASSLCGACKDACPVDIDLPRLLTRVRAGTEVPTAGGRGIGLSTVSRLGLKLYGPVASSPRLFTLLQSLGAIATRLLSPLSDWMHLPAFTGWGYSKDFPRVAKRSFRQQFRDAAAQQAHAPHSLDAATAAQASPQQEPPVDAFLHELAALGASPCRVSAAELPRRIVSLLKERGIDSVMAWDSVGGLELAQLERAGITVMHEPNPRIRAGITGAALGVADTGSLLLTSGPGQPLGTSLLPEVHIAVIPAARLVRSPEEALAHPSVPHSSAAVLITGPSRTADIEMSLTIGMHGPKELVVYVLE